jgi:microspherule protein 1/U3 small nucleolar RNA-associated protein 25
MKTPRFAEVEQAILRSDLVSAVANGKGGEGREKALRGSDSGALRKIEALERSAQAASARLATAKGALAELVGTHTTFAIDRNEVVIGRSTEDLKVDVDLSLEGNATKISRQQAFLKLRWNGEFALRNVGRRPIWCNNAPITTGQRCVLAPHTLIEVGGMRLLFVPNPTLIRNAAPEGV